MTAKRRQTSDRDSKQCEREGKQIHDILLAFMDGSVKFPQLLLLLLLFRLMPGKV